VLIDAMIAYGVLQTVNPPTGRTLKTDEAHTSAAEAAAETDEHVAPRRYSGFRFRVSRCHEDHDGHEGIFRTELRVSLCRLRDFVMKIATRKAKLFQRS